MFNIKSIFKKKEVNENKNDKSSFIEFYFDKFRDIYRKLDTSEGFITYNTYNNLNEKEYWTLNEFYQWSFRVQEDVCSLLKQLVNENDKEERNKLLLYILIKMNSFINYYMRENKELYEKQKELFKTTKETHHLVESIDELFTLYKQVGEFNIDFNL